MKINHLCALLVEDIDVQVGENVLLAHEPHLGTHAVDVIAPVSVFQRRHF